MCEKSTSGAQKKTTQFPGTELQPVVSYPRGGWESKFRCSAKAASALKH